MDLDLLHSFVSVVDAGGFTRAGERVHRTQSTVSQQIRKLEDALGCALFIREGRGVRLTEDGERLLGYARRMLALSNEIREVVSQPAPGPGPRRTGPGPAQA
ncbi:LysR family transcriptional regulator [Bordetella pertussis]|nr:LysR family transcriptional regulator [Bordetella pertussis]